ncbi:U3 snoRNP protein [Toensbergia leucococca]|nr:U3 snoRNP protein [Toensbergia leucococca]
MTPAILESAYTVASQNANSAITDLHPSSEQIFLSTLIESAYTFLQPPSSLHAASLVITKRYLDPLAFSVSEAQGKRLQDARKKRKRGEIIDSGSEQVLRMKRVHVEGFEMGQIWEQARRVLDASREEVERCLPHVLPRPSSEGCVESLSHHQDERVKTAKFREDGFEIGEFELDEIEDMDTEDMDDFEDIGADTEDGIINGIDLGRGTVDDLDELSENKSDDLRGENDKGISSSEDSLDDQSPETFVPDKHGLNDGFFSIDDFNRQSEFLEQQDQRADAKDGGMSDEEEVDWDANPLNSGSNRPDSRLSQDNDIGDEDSEDEEDGPIFGNADLNASDSSNLGNSLSDADDQTEGFSSMNNTNDIKYAEFFAPPPRKATKFTRRRPLPKTQPPPSATPADNEEDIQRTISAVRRDLFEDDVSAKSASSNAPSDTDPSNPLSRRSNHQKRQAALASEIRRLEAASVAKRDWTLSGEARAADRPINSLLEEDLDFERAGKPLPVITNEISEDIEALIKRRILAREFDEVIRRRPDNLVTGKDSVRRGRFELDDSKPQQSLADMYEAEHLKNVDPEGYVDKKDEKLKREYAEIERMWNDVSTQLDALSNWHYKPKPPQASINIVADVPTITLEDARPSGGGEASMLAPQEVYKPGEGKGEKEEVMLKSGVAVGRREMSREEKIRRRRREKERIRKAGDGDVKRVGGGVEGRKAREKREVVGALKKGGVRVIGRRGELKDVEGKAVKSPSTATKAGGSFKL